MAHLSHKSPNLQAFGPIIDILVVPPKPIADLLRSEGKVIPTQKVIALIDTGASNSCIDKSVAKALGLVSHDIKRVHTAGGDAMQLLYDAAFVTPLSDIAISLQVLEVDFTNQPYRLLLGRDVLEKMTFVYNGWDNSYTLHI